MLASWYIAGTIIVLCTMMLLLTRAEARRGERLVFRGLRDVTDRVVAAVTAWLARQVRHVVRYIITLSWYYSIHAFLRVVLQVLAGLYHILEALLVRNRERARAIRKERRSGGNTHLRTIADHKEETKLTPAEEKKRKDKALKGL